MTELLDTRPDTLHDLPADATVGLGVLAVTGMQVAPNQDADSKARLGAYVDSYMAAPYPAQLGGDQLKQRQYGDALTDLATSRFDLDLLMQDRFPGQEFNPVLNEFAGILASLDHNAGVYYSQDEVLGLFDVIAGAVLDDPSTDDRLRQATAMGSVKDFDAAILDGFKNTFSLDRDISLALMQDSDGSWRQVAVGDYAGDEDIHPLEVIRQDNADKGGWNKFRFRTPTYRRGADESHDQPVGQGWFTTEWIEEPSYWTSELRTTLHEGLLMTQEQLQGSGMDIALISEGGVLKGTSTAETDVDTTCVVMADSVSDFDRAYEAGEQSLNGKLTELPFALKANQRIGMIFIDRTTGDHYLRSERGDYNKSAWDVLSDGRYVFRVRNHEKGVGVTTEAGFKPFKKTIAIGTTDQLVGIDIETGAIEPLSDEDAARYTEDLAHLQRTRRAAAVDDETDWA